MNTTNLTWIMTDISTPQTSKLNFGVNRHLSSYPNTLDIKTPVIIIILPSLVGDEME